MNVFPRNNWRGSTNGGGTHQVIFGFSASGLTPQQLGQIRFRNPAGLPTGDYGARILSTGEIVPSLRPPVSYSKMAISSFCNGLQDGHCKQQRTLRDRLVT